MTNYTTPFVEHHRAAGAKMVPFAGFIMPLQYEGIRAEHGTVRNDVGLFDVSHMGEFKISGPGAIPFVDRLVTNHVADAEAGQAIYTPMCLPDGGIVDDLLVYRYDDHLILVVNAANIQSDWEHVKSNAPDDVEIENLSSQIAQLAIQGPRAIELFSDLLPAAALELPYYRFIETDLWDVKTVVSRTGYTGEDGFELYFPSEYADRFWTRLMRSGEKFGIKPCGLGARDLLRLEMGFCLYGNDIDRTTHPLEAGLGWTVKLDKPDFISRDFLTRVKAEGLPRKLVGFEAEGPRIPRPEMQIELDGSGIGNATSGTFSPSLAKGIGMGYVTKENAKLDTCVEVTRGTTRIPVRIVRKPFYQDAYHSRKRVSKPSEA